MAAQPNTNPAPATNGSAPLPRMDSNLSSASSSASSSKEGRPPKTPNTNGPRSGSAAGSNLVTPPPADGMSESKRVIDIHNKYHRGLEFLAKSRDLLAKDDPVYREASLQNRVDAFECLRVAAEGGHAAASYEIGLMFLNGYEATKIDYMRARAYFVQSARHGHSEAAARLGYMIATECGFSDKDKVNDAIDLWRLSADWSVFSQVNLGAAFLVARGDQKEANKYFKLAIPTLEACLLPPTSATASHPSQNFLNRFESILTLAFCFHNGYGMERNNKKGTECYEMAANAGCAAAQYHLGECYRRGLGVTKDLKRAIRLFALSAKQGFGLACARMGEAHWRGEGLEQNMRKALELYQMAASSMDPAAVMEAEKFFVQLPNEKFTSDSK